MSAPDATETKENRGRERLLDPVERVSEMCFGLFMALTFVGMVSAATAGTGADAGRTLLITALGCNLAWGLVDAVMYLVRTAATRGKRLSIARDVRRAPDAASGRRILERELAKPLKGLVSAEEIESIRARIVALPSVADGVELDRRDLMAALGIFLIVVLTTFPVALPFVLFADTKLALVVSRALTIALLFGGGIVLGRYAGYGGWKTGFWFVGLGVGLTVAIIALGG